LIVAAMLEVALSLRVRAAVPDDAWHDHRFAGIFSLDAQRLEAGRVNRVHGQIGDAGRSQHPLTGELGDLDRAERFTGRRRVETPHPRAGG
jgi:hypothetical protein